MTATRKAEASCSDLRMAGRLKADALAAAMKLRRESGVIDAPAGDSLETIEAGDWTKRPRVDSGSEAILVSRP